MCQRDGQWLKTLDTLTQNLGSRTYMVAPNYLQLKPSYN